MGGAERQWNAWNSRDSQRALICAGTPAIGSRLVGVTAEMQQKGTDRPGQRVRDLQGLRCQEASSRKWTGPRSQRVRKEGRWRGTRGGGEGEKRIGRGRE